MEKIIQLSKSDLKSLIIEIMSEMPAREHESEPTYYSRNELAALLHVTLPTLWHYEKTGQLKPKKIGRRVLYEKEAIRKLMDSGELARYRHS